MKVSTAVMSQIVLMVEAIFSMALRCTLVSRIAVSERKARMCDRSYWGNRENGPETDQVALAYA